MTYIWRCYTFSLNFYDLGTNIFHVQNSDNYVYHVT
jgi:hypothetical protein